MLTCCRGISSRSGDVSVVSRATCWTRVAVTARCDTPTSTVCWSGSASAAAGPASSAATASRSWPSTWRDRGRWGAAGHVIIKTVNSSYILWCRTCLGPSKLFERGGTLCVCAAVAGGHHHPGGEGPDHRRVPGLALPGGEHLLAAVVGPQPPGHLATPRRPLPDLLRHVRLHGPGLHRWLLSFPVVASENVFSRQQMLLKVSLSLINGCKIQMEPQKHHRNGKIGLQCLPVQAEMPTWAT